MNPASGTKSCKICGGHLPGRKTKACSEICFEQLRKYRHKAYSKTLENMTERTCPYCGTKFLRFYQKTGNFCNRSCAGKFYVENGTYDTCLTRMIPSGETVRCPQCGINDLYLGPKDLKEREEGKRKFCSVECFHEWEREYYKTHPGSQLGKKMPESSKAKQRATWMEKYGVPNAFLLKKQGNESKVADLFHESLRSIIDDRTVLKEQNVFERYRADTLIDDNIVVEFFGDFWHMNPSIYSPDFYNGMKHRMAKEIWERDAERKRILENAGFRVICVWEKDWKECPNDVLDFVKWTVSL